MFGQSTKMAMAGVIPLFLTVLLFPSNRKDGFVQGSASTASVERKLQILNESGRKVELYWIHPQTREMVLTSDPHIFNGASFNLNSFVGHEFEVREVPSARTGECGDEGSAEKTCRTGHYAVNQNEEQVIHVLRGSDSLELKHVDNKSLARDKAVDLLTLCRDQAHTSIQNDASEENAKRAVADLASCVESSIASTLETSNEEIAFQASIRKDMADLLENYTCADEELNTTEAVEETSWVDPNHRVKREVLVLHDRPSSKIHLIKNFISDDECRAMEAAAKPKLHRATVADGKGGSEYSDSRKAMQAGIKVPWSAGGHIPRLSRRVYDYVNHVLAMDIKEQGQEDLMSIQYFGRGDDDTEPDRYKPHCDGDCKGLPHKTGTRVATMVMYCTVPDRGGATNFKNAGIHIVPEAGSATFFSYINPENHKMDTGFTEHSGCPVIEGEKKIVTQWVRLGVDKENPWNSFNTLGLKHSDMDKD